MQSTKGTELESWITFTIELIVNLHEVPKFDPSSELAVPQRCGQQFIDLGNRSMAIVLARTTLDRVGG